MPELTDDHFAMLSHFETHGGTLTYESIVENPPRHWDKHQVAGLLRELSDVGLLKRGELTLHTITEKGVIAYKINIALPDVYHFLFSKRNADYISWNELVEKLKISDDIADILQAKLFNDGYIKTSDLYSIEEDERFEITQKFNSQPSLTAWVRVLSGLGVAN
jgi:hypothetical protein